MKQVYSDIFPQDWLTETNLTEAGKTVRAAFKKYCQYINCLPIPSFQKARIRYFEIQQTYWSLANGFALPPHTVNISPNNICNYNCQYCDFGQQAKESFYHQYNVVDASKKIELPLELCKNLVNQCEWFLPIIRASFREPTLWKGLLPLIEHTRSKNMSFWLLTNGFHLPTLAGDFVRLGLDAIRLSLDGPPETHDQICGVKGAYARMISGVKTLVNETKTQKQDMQIGFYYTLCDTNQNHLLATIEALDKEGLLKNIFINFQWLLYTTPEMADLHNQHDALQCGATINASTVSSVNVSKIDFRGIALQKEEIEKRFPASAGYRIHFRPSFEPADLKNLFETIEPPVDNPRCHQLWYNLNVNPEGAVKSFHHCFLPVVGSVAQQPLMDIWNGSCLREQRLLLKKRGAYIGCARCWGVYANLDDAQRQKRGSP